MATSPADPPPIVERPKGGLSVMRDYLESPERFTWPQDERKRGVSYGFSADYPPHDWLIWERSLLLTKKTRNAFIDQHRFVPARAQEVIFTKSFARKELAVDTQGDTNNEVIAMTDLLYPHIAALLGTYTYWNRLYILIFPAGCCDLGDLMNCISQKLKNLQYIPVETPASVPGYQMHRVYSWPFREKLESQLRTLRGYFLCLCCALTYLHESNVRHKDIKPANIIVDFTGNVVLMDFGISTKFEPTASHITANPGTASTSKYRPPEMANETARDDRSDVWSLGCVFLEMASLLLGKDLKACHDQCSHPGKSGGVVDDFCLNIDGVKTWLNILREASWCPLGTEAGIEIKKCLPTIAQMLEERLDDRPDAKCLWRHFDFPSQQRCPDCYPEDPRRWQPNDAQKQASERGKKVRQQMQEAETKLQQQEHRAQQTRDQIPRPRSEIVRSAMGQIPEDGPPNGSALSLVYKPRRPSFGPSIRSTSPPLQRHPSPVPAVVSREPRLVPLVPIPPRSPTSSIKFGSSRPDSTQAFKDGKARVAPKVARFSSKMPSELDYNFVPDKIPTTNKSLPQSDIDEHPINTNEPPDVVMHESTQESHNIDGLVNRSSEPSPAPIGLAGSTYLTPPEFQVSLEGKDIVIDVDPTRSNTSLGSGLIQNDGIIVQVPRALLDQRAQDSLNFRLPESHESVYVFNCRKTLFSQAHFAALDGKFNCNQRVHSHTYLWTTGQPLVIFQISADRYYNVYGTRQHIGIMDTSSLIWHYRMYSLRRAFGLGHHRLVCMVNFESSNLPAYLLHPAEEFGRIMPLCTRNC